MARLEAISEISEEEKSKKVDSLWQQVLEAREAVIPKTPTLSPVDEKISTLKDVIPTDLFSNAQSLPTEVSQLSLTDEITESKTQEESAVPKKKKESINLQWHNIQLASKLDRLYSSKILGKGEDLKKQLELQNNLLDLKALLPKDLTSGKKIELSEKTKNLIDKLNNEHQLNFDKNDISTLRVEIDSQLDRIKLEVQHGFTDLQTLNHERMLIFQLAQRQRDERDTMVRNQVAH